MRSSLKPVATTIVVGMLLGACASIRGMARSRRAESAAEMALDAIPPVAPTPSPVPSGSVAAPVLAARPEEPPASEQRPGEPRFRPDLEGFRGIAILLVLLCHARLPGAEAGFIGVDVFFVLSGFLITGLLVDESQRTGRIRLGAFYARRARRILPAAIVVLASTLLAAQLVLSPLDLPRVADDALAASLSVANVRFALDATDYFAPVAASPVLHYWSLGVEEQFYLLWPVLLLLATRARRPRLVMALLVTVILAGSFLLSLVMTATNGPWAYYMLPTRAWQLAAGGLLALAVPLLGRMPRAIAALVGWLGVGLLGAGLVLIGPMTQYPGLAALLPTLGAAAIIASGGRAGSPGRIVLATPPLRWLGRISYSLYLWHWPILVLGPVALGLASSEEGPAEGDLLVRLGLVLVAVVLAALSWRLVEEPFRRGRLSLGRPSLGGRVRGFAMAGVLVIGVGSTTMGAVTEGDLGSVAAFDGGQDPVRATPAVTPSPSPSFVGYSPTPSPSRPGASAAPSANPTPAPTPTPSPRPSPRIDGRVPGDLKPSLGASRADDDPLLADGCGLSLAGTKPPSCIYGDRNGAITVALVGDSHAAHWFPALDVVAKQRGWRLVPFTKFSCVFVDLPIWSPNLNREYTECEAWRENVVDRLVKLKPDLVIISSNRWLPAIANRDNEPERQGAALARLIERVPGSVAILADTPRSDVDVPACLAKYHDAIERCTTTRTAAFGWRHLRRETEAARLTGATLVDMSDIVCPSDPCPPIIGNTLVYRDHHHLTATFVVSIAQDLYAALPPVRSP
jgi:peptidoglycan/LPS O-acetylase OafA/YrhL